MGLDEYDTVGTQRTVHGRFGTFQSRDTFYVIGIVAEECIAGITVDNVGNIGIVKVRYTVDNQQGRIIGHQSVDTTQIEECTLAGHSAFLYNLQARNTVLPSQIGRYGILHIPTVERCIYRTTRIATLGVKRILGRPGIIRKVIGNQNDFAGNNSLFEGILPCVITVGNDA